MTTKLLRIDWHKKGEQLVTESARGKILSITYKIDDAKTPEGGDFNCWIPFPCRLGFMQGYAVRACILEFKLPRVTHVAVTMDGAPFSLFGIRAHYDEGRQRIEHWFMDDGVSVTPILTKVYEKEEVCLKA